MYRSTFHIPYSIFAPTLCLLSFVFAFPASAAELSIGVGAKAADGSHDVVVLVRAGSPVNALEGTLNVPPDAELVEITDAGSPVQFWIERPHLSDTKDKITFSGIIPGGFSGEGALFHIRTNASPIEFTIDKKTTRILLNDGAGTEEVLNLMPQRALPLKFVLIDSSADKTPPNPFTPIVTTLPTENGENPSVVFNAHDDGSGIARYEIAYSLTAVDPSDPSLVWEIVTNPTLLQPEQSNKFIYVKAIDHAGNVRVAEISPTSRLNNFFAYFGLHFFAILTVVCVLALCILLLVRRRKIMSQHAQLNEKK